MSNPTCTNLELDYHFAVWAEFDMIGPEGGPFCLFDKESGIFHFFGEAKVITGSSFVGDQALVPLQLALSLGANLTAAHGMAWCQIGEVVCEGATYAEAALRTLIVHLAQASKSDHASQSKLSKQ